MPCSSPQRLIHRNASDARLTRTGFRRTNVSKGIQMPRSVVFTTAGFLSRNSLSNSLIFLVRFEFADLLFTMAGIDTNELTKTPNANVIINTIANEPSNFQTKKATTTGMVFCSAKMTVKIANPNATIKISASKDPPFTFLHLVQCLSPGQIVAKALSAPRNRRSRRTVPRRCHSGAGGGMSR